MKTRLLEATDGFGYGKFMIGIFDQEWEYPPHLQDTQSRYLLQQEGWDRRAFLFLDLSKPGCGAIFPHDPLNDADYDVKNRQLNICWLYVQVLQWVYSQDLQQLDQWPEVVRFDPVTKEVMS